MNNPSFKFISLTIENNIGLLAVNRVDALNALDGDVIDELIVALAQIAESGLKGLIFTGTGEKAFIAGADIKSMSKMSSKEALEMSLRGQQVTTMLEEVRFPVIAAVNGFALGGGCEMALACDFIMCTENAVFGLPEVSLGLIPGFGGTQRLAKVVGRSRAKELIYTGRMVKHTEALEIGLALKSYSTKDELIAASKDLIEKIGKNSPHAIGVAKFVLNAGVDLPNSEGLKIESSQFSEIFGSDDMLEGTQAFIEKRKPNFRD